MSRLRVHVMAVLLLFGAAAGALAQNTIISGTVRSPTLAPVRGAYVSITFLNLSAITDDRGVYRVVVPAAQATGQEVVINVSHLGFKEQSARVALRPGALSQDFTLPEEAIPLRELVVTGTAGNLERKAQSATVAKVDAAAVVRTAPVTNVANLLQSRVAGVSVQDASGVSGTAQTIRIRGLASVSLSNEPLVFIDGVRADDRNRQIYGVGGQQSSRLNDIRPEDIESIEIVKGPAAATLYGADASAGVIQIITKRGQAGSGFHQTIGVEYNSLDANYTPPTNFATCTAALASRPACSGLPVNSVISDNPLLRTKAFRTGTFKGLNWSGRGGGNNYGYYLSLTNDDENGTLPNNFYKAAAGTFNFDWLPTRELRVEAGFALNRVQTDLPINDNNIYGYLGGGLLGFPYTRGQAQDGWYAANRSVNAIQSVENDNTTIRTRPRLAVNYSPVRWFTNKLTVGADITRAEAHSFFPKNDSTWYGTADLNSGQIQQARENFDRVTVDYLGNVTARLLPELRADISFGSQYLTTRRDLTNVTGVGLITNTARSVDAASRLLGGGQQFDEVKTLGFFGQTQFGYKDRYYVQVAGRLDKASAFGQNAPMFFSPKVGFSYVLSEEPSFKANVPGFLSTVRLRGSWGKTGRSPQSTESLTTFSAAPYLITTTILPGVVPSNPGNADLNPERGVEFETGVDLGMFNERLGLEITYFDKTSRDLILRRPLPPSAGFNVNPFVNLGEMKNSGWEVAANAQLITARNLGWSARVALNTLHNEVADLGDVAAFGQLNRVSQGFPAYGFVSRKIRSIDVANNKAIVSDTVEFVGNLLPSFEGSAATTLSFFGHLDVYAQLDWKQDFYIYNNTDQFRERQFGQGERWVRRDSILTAEERITRFGPFFSETTGAAIAAGNVNQAYVQPGDFVRLREVSATYTLPNTYARRFLRAAGASIGFGVRNLKLWTDYPGADPEVNTDTSGTTRSEFLTVPTAIRYVFRLNLQY